MDISIKVDKKRSLFHLSTLLLLMIVIGMLSCAEPGPNGSNEQSDHNQFDQKSNLLAQMTNKDLNGFQWMNQPEVFLVSDQSIEIIAPEGSDFFNNPEDLSVTGTAPFLYKEVEGDFVAVAHLEPDFTDQWNAMALMVHIDSMNWIKFAFENSDATGPGIVSVVTRDVSDDANGAVLNEAPTIWLKLIRKNNLYSMLWSGGGKNYQMARLSAMKNVTSVKVGLEVQSPVGKPAKHLCQYFSIYHKTVEDLRKGD